MNRIGRLALVALVAGCATRPPLPWPEFDILRDPVPPMRPMIGEVPIDNPEDFETFLAWGELWFRDGAFGDEKAVSDVLGLLGGNVQVPCPGPAAPDCRQDVSALERYAAAVDALDGVEGNLFQGNGGGYTSDLVLTFPPGATLYQTIPVPERLATGMEVEAGSFWPIGLVPVPGKGDERWLPDLSQLTHDGTPYPDAPVGPTRMRLTCAFCHYSLDVDHDGKADLRSARRDSPTPGSAYGPEKAWGVGNTDLEFGWLLALSQNPLFGSVVYSGSAGNPGADAAVKFQNWVLAHYEHDPDAVLREVTVGMVTQPRGYADVIPDGMLGSIQFPTLYTRGAWPANTDGAQTNESDRNNSVWTGALDFTAFVGLANDRGARAQQPWEAPKIYDFFDARTFADLVTRYSPRGKDDAAARAEMIDDILGMSDGVPSLMDPEGMVVMHGPALGKALWQRIKDDPEAMKRVRVPADYPGDGHFRGAGMAALGIRIGTDPAWCDRIEAYLSDEALAEHSTCDDRKNPTPPDQRPPRAPRTYDVYEDDFMSEGVSMMLNWLDPPANDTPLLANAVADVPKGQAVFKKAGCEQCHRGAFGTDNRIYRLSDDESLIFGAPRAPTTAGWRVLNRGTGPAIETQPDRSIGSRALRRFLSAPYDPQTGKAYFWSSPWNGFFGAQQIGYKTTALRFLWASAPYLHDGGVGVAIRPGAAPEGTDLRALLKRAGGDDLVYGMGAILALAEADPDAGPRANAALSLQALLLERERERVVDHNERPEMLVLAGSQATAPDLDPVADRIPAATVGVHGVGHDFYIDDVPGGEDITALVAYLLALDDCPRYLPGSPDSLKCPTYDWNHPYQGPKGGYP